MKAQVPRGRFRTLAMDEGGFGHLDKGGFGRLPWTREVLDTAVDKGGFGRFQWIREVLVLGGAGPKPPGLITHRAAAQQPFDAQLHGSLTQPGR